MDKAYVDKLFSFEHLNDELAGVSSAFADLADRMLGFLPENAERTVAFRKLLEAKDAAVRCKVIGEVKRE